MGAITVADYIAKNNDVVLTMTKVSLLPISVMQYYEINILVKSDSSKSKMQKYQNVADKLDCSVDTVRRAVREMNKNV